ncbi:MAG: hypothetical protein V4671_03230, partial [Armatimonadota bacterium]
HINLLSLAWLLPLYRLGGMMAVLRALLTRPDQAMERWDGLTAGGKRQMVGIGALDAHALMKIGKKKYPIPSYADSFRAVMTHLLLPPKNAMQDSPGNRREAVYSALRSGRCYFSYDCLGDPKGFMFTSRNKTEEFTVLMGGKTGVGTKLAAKSPGSRRLIRLLEGGKVVSGSIGQSLEYTVTHPGAYRIEVYQYTFRLGPFFFGARPWIFSNPIYVS